MEYHDLWQVLYERVVQINEKSGPLSIDEVGTHLLETIESAGKSIVNIIPNIYDSEREL